jgi:Cu/Ag efflux pump CusA
MANPKPNEEVIIRLQPDVYKQLEDSLPAPVISTTTTDQQVSFALGIQYVLKKLREGFVVIR